MPFAWEKHSNVLVRVQPTCPSPCFTSLPTESKEVNSLNTKSVLQLKSKSAKIFGSSTLDPAILLFRSHFKGHSPVKADPSIFSHECFCLFLGIEKSGSGLGATIIDLKTLKKRPIPKLDCPHGGPSFSQANAQIQS
jgi:hypothetical protein